MLATVFAVSSSCKPKALRVRAATTSQRPPGPLRHQSFAATVSKLWAPVREGNRPQTAPATNPAYGAKQWTEGAGVRTGQQHAQLVALAVGFLELGSSLKRDVLVRY